MFSKTPLLTAQIQAAPSGSALHSGWKHDREVWGKQFTSLKVYLKFCLKSPPSHLLYFSDMRRKAHFPPLSCPYIPISQNCYTTGTEIILTIPSPSATGVHSTSYALRQHPEPRLNLVSHLGVSKAQKQAPRSSQTPKPLHSTANSPFKAELLAPPAAGRVEKMKKQLQTKQNKKKFKITKKSVRPAFLLSSSSQHCC